MTEPRRLVLKCFLSPGDIVMLTAAVRDLHRAHPGRFLTDMRTSAAALWEHNPYITPLDENDPAVETIEMHYPLINQCNEAPYHFIHGFAQYLGERLGVAIPLTKFKGDIHLSPLEKSWMSQVEETGYRGPFWIVMAGGKYDFTAKWWDPAAYQRVVDHFLGRLLFVQCGEKEHWHPRLKGVLDLVGKTDIRQLVRLVYHADGVLCPVTFAMHLAAAVETKPGKPRNRACVVVAGGREPSHWEAYPHHQYLHTNGALACCEHGGCWKSRCQPVGDGDPKDGNLCVDPVQVSPEVMETIETGDLRPPLAGPELRNLRIGRCMALITPEDVIRRIELYYAGGVLRYAEDVAAAA